MKGKALIIGILVSNFSFGAALMDQNYAQMLCQKWNETPKLVNMGKNSSWASVPVRKLFLYRNDCKALGQVELIIQNENGKAICTYGGAAKDRRTGNDFLMHAKTKNWEAMGRGDEGPMKAMMFGDLEFSGPKFVAMENMGPFSQFLLNIGRVPHTDACP